MKKTLVLLMAFVMVFALACCGTAEPAESTGAAPDSGKTQVMTYKEYAAAEMGAAVTVETYVQAKQSWWDGKATLYTQAEDGAYFIYQMPCTEEEYEKLTAGTKIRVTGKKSEWSGEIEITDATFEILEGKFTAMHRLHRSSNSIRG